MAKALLIIDYTNDFVADKGSLTVGKPAQTLAPEIMRLADQFLSQHDYVIFPTDGHRLNDPFNPETKLYPAHNIIGTPVRNYTAKSAAGLINIVTIPMSTNSIRTVTPPSKTPIWITTCGNGGLMKSGLLVFALIFVSSTPQSVPTTWITTLWFHKQPWLRFHQLVLNGRWIILKTY